MSDYDYNRDLAEAGRNQRELQSGQWRYGNVWEERPIPRGVPTFCLECGSEWHRKDKPNFSRLPRMDCEKCGTVKFYKKNGRVWLEEVCEGLITRRIEHHVWRRTKINGKLKTMCRYCGVAPIYPHLTYATSISVVQDMITTGELSVDSRLVTGLFPPDPDMVRVASEYHNQPSSVRGKRKPPNKEKPTTTPEISLPKSLNLFMDENDQKERSREEESSLESHLGQIAKEESYQVKTEREMRVGAAGEREKGAEGKIRQRYRKVWARMTIVKRYSDRAREKVVPIFAAALVHPVMKQAIPEAERQRVLDNAFNVMKRFDYALFLKNEPLLKHEQHLLDDRQLLVLAGAAIYRYGRKWLTQDQIIQMFPEIGNRVTLNSYLGLVKQYNPLDRGNCKEIQHLNADY